MRLAGALDRFWYLRGYLVEGQRRLERALAADPRPTAARAKAAMGASGTLVIASRDFATARARAEEALELHRTLGDAWGVANSRFLLGFADVEEGHFQDAVAPLEESLRLFGELGDETRVSIVTFNLVWAYKELGERERGRALAEDNLRRARAMGSERTLSFALDSLETYAREEGRLDEALSMNREMLRLRWSAGDRLHVADSLGRFAAALAAMERPQAAARVLSCSVSAFQELGISVPVYWETRNEETLVALREQLGEAAIAEAWEQGRKMTIDEAVALALDSVD